MRGVIVGAYPSAAILNEMRALIDAGKITPHVSVVLPLSEIQRAQELLATRHTRGKIVLRFDQ